MLLIYAFFADLIKVFDTIYHQLMFKLLNKFGYPHRPLNAIKKVYKDFKIQASIGKYKI